MNASHQGPKVLHGHPRCPEISQAAIRVWFNSRAILKPRKGGDMVCARGPLGAQDDIALVSGARAVFFALKGSSR